MTYFGKIPLRADLTILPAVPPIEKEVGFTIQHYQGAECVDVNGNFLIKPLYPGEIVLVDYWGQVIQGVVFQDGTDFNIDFSPGNGSGLGGFLEFDKDSRHCWTVSGFYNKKALQKLKGIGI